MIFFQMNRNEVRPSETVKKVGKKVTDHDFRLVKKSKIFTAVEKISFTYIGSLRNGYKGEIVMNRYKMAKNVVKCPFN